MRSLALAALLLVACSDDAPTLPAEFELVGTAGTLVASAACDPMRIERIFGVDGGAFAEFTVRMDRNEDFPGQSSAAPWESQWGACVAEDGGAIRCTTYLTNPAPAPPTPVTSWLIAPIEAGAHVVGDLGLGAGCTASVNATVIDPGR